MAVKTTQLWHRYLGRLPNFTCAMLEDYISRTKTIKSTSHRGYKFFLENFIHDFRVSEINSTDWAIRSKCYRSQKKTEHPHTIQINFKETDIKDHKCSCAAGTGLCYHTIATLYQLQHYNKLNLKSVPAMVSKTSLPQTWHIRSRHRGFSPKAISSLVVQKARKKQINKALSLRRKNQSTSGVKSTLYNPVTVPLLDVNIDQQLLPTLSSSLPLPQFVQIWSTSSRPLPVTTIFGEVPRGSLLAVQLTRPEADSDHTTVTTIANVPKPPEFQLPYISTHLQCALPYDSDCIFGGLSVNMEQAHDYEAETREQSENAKWHTLRKHRLTASKFKRVCSRKGNFETLAKQLTSDKIIQTQQMKYGLEQEPRAAANYANTFARNVYAVGFVINPSACHLGCSPDRRVFDPDADQSHGLLEIKCPSVDSIQECKYLKISNDPNLKLKTNHEYYYQVMGQLGITGAPWCDFFVQSKTDFYCERIQYDDVFFQEMKAKLDMFYFTYFLPCLTDSM